MDLQIGDKIRDVEDSDFYYIGTVQSLIPLTYKVELVNYGNGETNQDEIVGQTIEKQFWFIEKQVKGEWIQI